MDITLEQVDRLKEKANVSYGRAKEVLTLTDGNLLDALIFLEDHGEIPIPQGTRYTTRETTPPPPEPPQPGTQKKKPGLLTRLRCLLLDNELEIWRKDKPITALPVLVFLLLLVCLYWATLPLLILGLLLGFRYRFSGPEPAVEDFNRAFDAVADTAADLSRRVSQEFSRGSGKEFGPDPFAPENRAPNTPEEADP